MASDPSWGATAAFANLTLHSPFPRDCAPWVAGAWRGLLLSLLLIDACELVERVADRLSLGLIFEVD